MMKAIAFFAFVTAVVSIAGGFATGQVDYAATQLTADINDAVTTIPVVSTTGFAEPGFIIIDDEKIAYSDIDATNFQGNAARPLSRGTASTEATEHSEGAIVRTVQGSMLNSSMDYDIATITDAAGITAFIAIPIAVFSLVKNLIALPLGFLGTDLQILSVIWGVCILGLIVALAMAVIGGRRV